MPPETVGSDHRPVARRVLVMRPDNIGDVILAGPLMRGLRRDQPDRRIGLLASPAGAMAAPLLPWLDAVVTARPVWQDLRGDLALDPERELAFVERLRAGRWDAAIIATSFRQTAWPAAYAAYLAGIPVRVGFAPDFGGSLLSHPVDPPEVSLHQAERNLQLLEPLGVPIAGDQLEVVVPEDARRAVEARLAAVGVQPGEPILVVPGASAPARRPDPRRLGEAARLIARETGRPVIVTGTPRERALVAACRAAARGATAAVDLGDDLAVPEFAALVEAAAVVVCANSSALHLADALDRPVVATYAGTDLPTHWRARRARAAHLTVSTDCSPCYAITCPLADSPPCLALEPGDIADAALALLNGLRHPATPTAVEATWAA